MQTAVSIDFRHEAVYPKNFYDSSDICPMGFIYSIQICEISHKSFGPSHRKCPMCPMIFMNTVKYSFFTNQTGVLGIKHLAA